MSETAACNASGFLATLKAFALLPRMYGRTVGPRLRTHQVGSTEGWLLTVLKQRWRRHRWVERAAAGLRAPRTRVELESAAWRSTPESYP